MLIILTLSFDEMTLSAMAAVPGSWSLLLTEWGRTWHWLGSSATITDHLWHVFVADLTPYTLVKGHASGGPGDNYKIGDWLIILTPAFIIW